MSGYHLCQVKKARHPYFIESISTNIFTIEELCFYLEKNIYLLDQTIINEKLLDWIRDELGLVRLYRKLYEQLENGETIGNFILPIFKEIGYLSHDEFRELQEKIRTIEIQPEDLRRKMKADYLVEYRMYNNAIQEYATLLKNRNPGKMGVQFYAAVYANLASAYARLFLFEEAADCLWKSYETVRSNEIYRRYLATISLFLSRERRLRPGSRNAGHFRKNRKRMKKSDGRRFRPFWKKKNWLITRVPVHPEKDGLPHEGICGGPFCLGRMRDLGVDREVPV